VAARHVDWPIIVLDNLYRRGSEPNLPRLRAAGVELVEADVKSVLTVLHAWIAENADELADALGLRPGATGLQA
jgi:hypothetical protein